MNLLLELKALLDSFEEEKLDYALCGGMALAVYARPRATLDIDIMVEADCLDKAKQIAKRMGFTFPALPMEFKGGAVVIHRTTKIDAATGGYLVLNFLLATDEMMPSWNSRNTVEWEGRNLKVLSPDGLIRMKSLRGSGQDMDDIAYLRGLSDET